MHQINISKYQPDCLCRYIKSYQISELFKAQKQNYLIYNNRMDLNKKSENKLTVTEMLDFLSYEFKNYA